MRQQKKSEIRISTDAFIALVVAEATNREISAMPSLEEMNDTFHPSEVFQKKIAKLLKQTKRKQLRKSCWHTAKRMLVTATTVVTIFSCVLMPVQAVQEAVISTVLNWRDQFVEVIYSQEDNSGKVPLLQNVQLTYLPDGFTELEEICLTNSRYRAKYQSEQGDWFVVRILPIQDRQAAFIDDEYTNYYQISFDKIDAVWSSTVDGHNILSWQHDGLSYQLSSSCDLSEIIKIAEGIKSDISSNG